MRFLLLELILADQLASIVRTHIGKASGRYPPIEASVVKNGSMTFLLLELIWADHLADLPPSRGI